MGGLTTLSLRFNSYSMGALRDQDKLMPNNESEIRALILLLSETAPKNLEVIRNRLIELRESALPILKETLLDGKSHNHIFVTSMLEEIRLSALIDRWIHFASGTDPLDLEIGSFLYAEYHHPELNTGHYRKLLDQWASEISRLIASRESGQKPNQIFLNYLFQSLAFKGNRTEYYLAQNSYLPDVMDSRLGLPITLSVILLLLAGRTGHRFFPIGMPGHFIVKYEDHGESFFVDSFDGGKILTQQDCINFLTQSGYGYREEYLQVISTRFILERMLRNLVTVYSQTGHQPGVQFMTRLIEILREY